MNGCKYRIILKNHAGEKHYVEAFNDDGTPKIGPRNRALEADFNLALSMAQQIRVASPEWKDITVSEVADDNLAQGK